MWMTQTFMTETASGWCIPLVKRMKLRQWILFGILGALIFALKVCMAVLPNIEPVSLLLLVLGAVMGFKTLYPMYVYVAMEILCFGLGTWNFCYLYVWLVPVLAGVLLKKMDASLGWALVSGVFGLVFGALCGIVDIFIGGFGYAAAKWISGIPFDIAHCAGNFVMALVLFQPLRKLLERLYVETGR